MDASQDSKYGRRANDKAEPLASRLDSAGTFAHEIYIYKNSRRRLDPKFPGDPLII